MTLDNQTYINQNKITSAARGRCHVKGNKLLVTNVGAERCKRTPNVGIKLIRYSFSVPNFGDLLIVQIWFQTNFTVVLFACFSQFCFVTKSEQIFWTYYTAYPSYYRNISTMGRFGKWGKLKISKSHNLTKSLARKMFSLRGTEPFPTPLEMHDMDPEWRQINHPSFASQYKRIKRVISKFIVFVLSNFKFFIILTILFHSFL